MNWAVVTGVVAVYGAMLSTWNAITNNREKRRHISVKMSYGCETYHDGRLGPFSIVLTALNKGHRPITLEAAGVLWPDGRTSVGIGPSGNTRFPHELDGGKSCLVCLPVQDIVGQLKRAGFSGTVRLDGFFRDALDETYTKGFDFDLENTGGVIGDPS